MSIVRAWTQDEIDKARRLLDEGFERWEIADIMGRSITAVTKAINGATPAGKQWANYYLKDLDGPPVGITMPERIARKKAIEGSARLAAEINRLLERAA